MGGHHGAHGTGTVLVLMVQVMPDLLEARYAVRSTSTVLVHGVDVICGGYCVISHTSRIHSCIPERI